MATGLGEPREKVRGMMVERMVLPVGKPRGEDEDEQQQQQQQG